MNVKYRKDGTEVTEVQMWIEYDAQSLLSSSMR